MNTLRVCATVGLGLSLVLGIGCSSSSKSGNADGSTRDTRRSDGPQSYFGPDTTTTSAQACTTLDGTKVQPGKSIVIDCVTWTCVSGTNFNGTGTSCADAGRTTDVAVKRDTASPADARPDEAGVASDGGGKDTQPGLDVGGKDTSLPEVSIPLDTAPPELDVAVVEDTAQPEPDLPVLVDDTAPPVTCTYATGQTYGLGVQFPCGCKTCECDVNVSSGSGIINIVADNCAVDAQ